MASPENICQRWKAYTIVYKHYNIKVNWILHVSGKSQTLIYISPVRDYDLFYYALSIMGYMFALENIKRDTALKHIFYEIWPNQWELEIIIEIEIQTHVKVA